MRKILIALLFFPVISHADEWQPVHHVVQQDETVRLIARKYIGVKQAGICLQGQLQLPDPNKIAVGLELDFWAPTKKYSLADYQALDIVCKPGLITIDQKPVASGPATREVEKTNANWPSPSTDIKPVVEPPQDDERDSLYHLQRISKIELGTGLNYTDLDQNLVNSANIGRATYRDISPLNAWVMGRYGIDPHWSLEGAYESIPGHLPATGGGPGPSFRWQTLQGLVLFQPKFARYSLSTLKFYGFLRLGAALTSLPLMKPVEHDDSTYSLDTLYANLIEGKLGFGLVTLINAQWASEICLHYGTPIARGDFQEFKPTYMFDGSVNLTRQFSDKVYSGIQWHGQAFDAQFTASELAGQSKYIYSSLELLIGRLF